MSGMFVNWAYIMLGLHWTPEGCGTDDPKSLTRGYSGIGWQGRMFLLCSSPEGHKLLWILVITQVYSPLKWTSSTIAFNRHKRSWNWSISLASDPTRSWILLCSQIFLGWSWFTRWPRMWFGTVVNRSQVTLEIFVSCKVLPNHTGNSRRSHPGRMSVAYRSQSIIGHSGVGCNCITLVGLWLWFWGLSLWRQTY